MAVINVDAGHTTSSKSFTLDDLKEQVGSAGDSGTGKGIWALDSVYYPYKKGDVIYYKGKPSDGVNEGVPGSYLANNDNGDEPIIANINWTKVSNSFTETGKLWPLINGSIGNGKGDYTTEGNYIGGYMIGDIVYYGNGGLYGSYMSLIDNNITLPEVSDNWVVIYTWN